MAKRRTKRTNLDRIKDLAAKGDEDAKRVVTLLGAAEDGNVKAQFHLGNMFKTGSLGLTPDKKQAKKWYKKARDAIRKQLVKHPPSYSLRSFAKHFLTPELVGNMIKEFNFFCSDSVYQEHSTIIYTSRVSNPNPSDPEHNPLSWYHESYMNPKGRGLKNDFQPLRDFPVLYDAATGLYWQEEPSKYEMPWDLTNDYLEELNSNQQDPYDDWRLPTLQEAMSLLKRIKKDGVHHIEPIFKYLPDSIWTADSLSGWSVSSYFMNLDKPYPRLHGRYWGVDVIKGLCHLKHSEDDHSVLAVRADE